MVYQQTGIFAGQGSFHDVEPGAWTATVDYGDGSGPRPLTLGQDGRATLQYAQPGAFRVTVRVTDAFGASGEASLPIQVVETMTVYLPLAVN